MYKTKFQAWGVKKYGVDRTTKYFDDRIRIHRARDGESHTVGRRTQVDAAHLPHSVQAAEPANHIGPAAAERPNLSLGSPCMLLQSSYLDVTSSSNESSHQSTDTSSDIHTPVRSRDTSRPSSSDRASLLTPGSSWSGDGHYLPSLAPAGSDISSARTQEWLGGRSDFEKRASRPRRASQIPRSVPQCPMEGIQSEDPTLADQTVDHVIGFSSPSISHTQTPSKTFRSLMALPLNSSTYQSDAFRQELGDMRSPNQDLDFVSPQPETWITLCFYINFLLVQEQTSAARHAMRRAAMIYQRLVRERNDQLLSILNLVLANLFLYRKQDLAAELLSQAQTAALVHLHKDDPIIDSISFMISMALKRTRSSGIRISKLRQVAEVMRLAWGEDHPYCITADYQLAWRLAMESDLRREALEILRQTQFRAERVLGCLHMQTVALITTQARVHGHLGHHFEAERTMSEALQRIKAWNIADDYPYYVEAKRRYKVFLEELDRVRSR